MQKTYQKVQFLQNRFNKTQKELIQGMSSLKY